MKDGFYLSPCGNHIIEIRIENFIYQAQVYSPYYYHVVADSINKTSCKILFANWQRLA